MSYQVLARKWRPRHFKEMVGQEPILRMLTNALDNERLHHAYLFTGTRGVGKTTLARILAKCLNCEVSVSSTPCGTCSACQSIDSGRFLDLIEIDAASRTKVEDTRELLDNVPYAPSQGRYKIYLIDEVHMLSGHSFNALLKTLEEPPSHVKFLLATTDPKKLPITILSRCLQFHLKRVPVPQIAQHLQHICKTENIGAEETALTLLAEAADGSIRDALSLLDQTIAFCQNHITLSDTQQLLGHVEEDCVFRLIEALAEQNGEKLLTEISQLAEFSPDFTQVLENLLTLLHQISIAQIIPEKNSNERVSVFAKRFSAEEIQLYYQIGLIGRRDLPLAPNTMQGFEMVMLRMLAFRPSSIQKPQERPSAPSKQPEIKKPEVKNSETNWSDIIAQLKLTGLAHTLATNCTLTTFQDNHMELSLAVTHEPMLNKKLSDRIEEALTRYFNRTIKLTITTTSHSIQTPAKLHQEEKSHRHAKAVDAIQNDTDLKKIVDTFNAKIDPDSIKSVES